MSIEKSKTNAIGWTIVPCFIITGAPPPDIELLKAINKLFKVGSPPRMGGGDPPPGRIC